MRYEVQHYTIFYGWVNTWAYAEADGVMQPETFATAEEAAAALDEFLEDVEEEAAAGQMAYYDRDQFRVWPDTRLGIRGRLDAVGGAP